ncbi:ABC transporter ATP-binding protein [Actinoplanes rectilineatus]|uniref:ABC transporter ATP-binding protein n=1 Tax=Actinoplanes rectilineatus TaxID=113571 RepID=UPI0005F2A7F7|nr:ABC transporter ATP-binding protein [Actinoplanes rectilineatus]
MTVVLHEVHKRYRAGAGAVVALDGVTVHFGQATFTAVMGPSGSGKSTLLHCAAGLEPVTSGSVTVAGTALDGLAETALTKLRRDRVGFVFQEFNLVSSLTAAQNVSLPLRLAGRRAEPSAVQAALTEVGLADRAGHRPRELSGGQQQRVAIARALFTSPSVVFADEPTGALDSQTSHQVLELMRRLVDAHGRTVVMVTHDPVAAAVADRVLLLVDGRVTDEIIGADATTVADRMTALERRC